MRTSDNNREKEIYKVTLQGSVVNFSLLIFKFIAGILGNSSAMIADAVHSLSDFITDIIVIVFVKVSNKPKDHDHDYGHGKFETLATLLISVILFIVGLGIAWNGITSIISITNGNHPPQLGTIALIAALLSLISKEILYHYTLAKGKKIHSDAVIANAWHHRSDALSSIASAIGIGGALILGDKWTILDPLAGVIVSVLIVKSAFELAKPSLDELLEKSLPDETEQEMENIVYSFDGLENLHNLRTRKIGSYYAIEFHIRMNGDISLKKAHDLISKVEKRLKEEYGPKTHVIIHMEPIV